MSKRVISCIPITTEEVTTASNRLNDNKAIDVMGLTREHFKLAGQEITEFLTCILNYIVVARRVSTVLSEHIFNTRHNRLFQDTQSRLQKGFTSGCSSLNAAFILSECILKAKKKKNKKKKKTKMQREHPNHAVRYSKSIWCCWP